MDNRKANIFGRVEKLPDWACIALGFTLFLLILILCGCGSIRGGFAYCPRHTTQAPLVPLSAGDVEGVTTGGIHIYEDASGRQYAVRGYSCSQCPDPIYITNYLK